MQAHLPWLTQGDIFRNAPVVDVVQDDIGQLRVSLPLAPAILLTHGCAMDKPNPDGRPRIERLQLARLRSVTSLDEKRRGSLRGQRRSLGPYEALYVGDVIDLGETFILLSDPYYLPTSYFDLRCEGYADHPDAEADAMYATPHEHDTRMGRLNDDTASLLTRKMAAFWARISETPG